MSMRDWRCFAGADLPIWVQTASVNCARYCEGVLGWFACGGWPLTCVWAGCGPPWCGGMPVVGDGCWCVAILQV